MEYNEFVEAVKKRLDNIFHETGQQAAVTIERVLKNNGLELTGVNILKDNERISPTIYINSFFRNDMEEYEIDNVVRQIKSIYESRCGYADTLADRYVNVYCDYEKIKDKIIYKLVNMDMNKERLEDVPYLPYNDLAITFRYMAYKGDMGIASSIISNDDMERWKINISTLYNLAKKNTKRYFPAVVKRLTTLLEEHKMLPEDNVFNVLESANKNILYIMTNEECVNGATTILYENLLDKCAALVDDNIYIMPSSIHEIIFTGERNADNPVFLKEIVKEANDSVVHPTEILSYNVYFYNRKDRTLKII